MTQVRQLPIKASRTRCADFLSQSVT
uniref:Uncharacterized protein n=1 Tax=Anguilla anguilla TaxID=7936 RepID=A0A0E9V8R9_ANGAN